MIVENLKTVQNNIKESIQKRHNIISQDVLLVAVTKNHDVEAMREAIDAGAAVIGENRVQEASQKYAVLDRNVTWHLIGHLQTNKVKHAVKIFDMIESVDSIKLAEAINKEAAKLGKVQKILVQVNLVKEASKTGVYLEDLPELLTAIDGMDNLKLMGLMFIAPIAENPEDVRPMFNQMYNLFIKVQKMPLAHADIKYLSMGMTHDYQIAIEEGANIVRVGTAIFGPRQY
ncbi:YggS family pyridoxal phosphate-dependent enzyme [Megamonas hypermegale]|uniref:YggS family pyridoxal phosphate-dependent enzyme n=1 Tax=Megamonas hypermegale TaxID=158847 RepID=UPI0026EB644D|nr:YggS family pyridoxal phosphate-dependent enzyme [Megamonas hypermegale]